MFRALGFGFRASCCQNVRDLDMPRKDTVDTKILHDPECLISWVL